MSSHNFTSKLPTFRLATRVDLAEVLSFPLNRTELFYFFPSASYPLTLDQFEKQLCERYQSTVMLEDGQLVGFANFYNIQNRNIAFIGNVIIKPDKRRQGLGKKLLQTMIKTGFRQMHLKEVHLSCYEQNSSALIFYTRLGFKPYATETRYDPDNHPVELLHLRLKKQALSRSSSFLF